MMCKNSANIKFKGSLQDFTDAGEKPATFHLNPSVKDLIESCGVPHVEVFGVEVNGEAAGLDINLQNNDRLVVYPKEYLGREGAGFAVKPVDELPGRFIADVHLGKLARLLRLIGADTAYSNSANDAEIAEAAVRQQRAVLTRDVGLLKHGKLQYGYWLRSTDPKKQILEVIRYFDLSGSIKPFSRCLNCNGLLEKIEKSKVLQSLPQRVRQTYDEFKRCKECGNLYWKGTHYKELLKKIEDIESRINI